MALDDKVFFFTKNQNLRKKNIFFGGGWGGGLEGQQLCSAKIILKSMHKCTSYALDKLNTCL